MNTPESDPSGDPNSDKARWIKGVGLLGVITTELLASTGAGVGIGYLLWKKAGFPWWSLLICSLAGMSVAFYRLYQISKKDW
jgi:F0F1-type ATP synthase assembly protein I